MNPFFLVLRILEVQSDAGEYKNISRVLVYDAVFSL
jgi:hypothetical protein